MLIVKHRAARWYPCRPRAGVVARQEKNHERAQHSLGARVVHQNEDANSRNILSVQYGQTTGSSRSQTVLYPLILVDTLILPVVAAAIKGILTIGAEI